MLAEIGKFVGAKVAAAIIFLAVTAAGIWCYQNPDAVRAFGVVVKHTLISVSYTHLTLPTIYSV